MNTKCYVIQVKSKDTGKWLFAKAYHTRKTAVQFVDKLCKFYECRIVRYANAFDWSHDSRGVVCFERSIEE